MNRFFSSPIGFLVKAVLVFFLCTLIGMGLLVIVYSIPTGNKTHKNVENSINSIESHTVPGALYGYGKKYRLLMGGEITPQNFFFNNAAFYYDHFTDKTMLIEIDSITGQNPLKEAMSVNGYARYWHGYLIFLKPVLFFLNYHQIQILSVFIMVLLYTWLLIKMFHRSNKMAISFLFSTIMIAAVTIPFSMQYYSMFYLMIASALFFLYFEKWINQNIWNTLLLFLIQGCITSYFDFLTAPLMPFGILLVLLTYTDQNHSAIIKIRNIFLNGISWCTGYVGLWGIKWVLASLILKDNIIKDAYRSIRFRSSSYTEMYGNGAEITRFKAIISNFSCYTNIIFPIILLLFLIAVIIYRKKLKNSIRFRISSAAPMLMIMALPLLWYAVFVNHSYIHGIYSFRSLMMFWMSLSCILLGPEAKSTP